MKIYSEKRLINFDFWCGAKDTFAALTYDEIEQIEAILEDAYPEGISETMLNDLFWFEENTIAEWLGYNNFEELTNRDTN